MDLIRRCAVAVGNAGDQRLQLVLDASGSMREPAAKGTKIQAARKSLTSMIDTLPSAAQVGLRVYGAAIDSGAGSCTDSQEVVPTGADNRDKLRSAVKAFKPLGETPIGYALKQAAKDLGSEGKRTIVLVSDGEATCAPDPCKVARDLSKTGIDLKIDVVGLSVDAESLTRSIEVLSTRAFRPFDLTGIPVEGTEDPAAAPALEVGQYLDKIPLRGHQVHYKIPRTVTGSTIHVGTTARTDAGSTGSAVMTRLLAGDPADSQTCASGASYENAVGANRPLLAASISSWTSDSESACNTADTLALSLEINTDPELAHTPVKIAVYEEPPLADGAERDLPPADQGATWTAMSPGTAKGGVIPGTSFVNAPVIEPGTYQMDIRSGETQVFAIPVDWGQQLQAQLDADLPDRALEHAGVFSGFGTKIIGPVREEATYSQYGDEPKSWTTTAFGNLAYKDDHHYRIGAMTAKVQYLIRISSDSAISASSLPGYRYIEVNFSVLNDVTIRYKLSVKVLGDAGQGAPDYADVDGLTDPSADNVNTLAASPDNEGHKSDKDDPGAASASKESGTDGGIPVPPADLAGGGALLLVAGAVAIVLARRSRG